MNIVIAGLGVAGATAAETARRLNPKAYITIFSQERNLFYYRPRLPEVVSGDLAPDQVYVHPKGWYDELRLDLRIGEKMVDMDLSSRTIRGSTGSRQTYDRLLLAVGAEANRPPLPGDRLENVFAVRSLNDAWTLSLAVKDKKRAVIIGGGLLGLETGLALAKRGLGITVLEMGDRVLPRQTTPRGAALLRRKLAAAGLDFELQTQAARLEGFRQVESVVLKDGRALEAGLVIISAGVNPNLALAAALGLATDRAIVVDEYLETSAPDVYAAGDCAQFPGAAGGLWTTAQAQGLVAGANLAARNPEERRKFAPAPPSNTLKVAGVELTAAGDLDPEGRLKGIEAENDEVYRKVVVDAEGRLAGFTNVGSAKGNLELARALAEKAVLPPRALAGLAELDFDFSGLY
ncbi:MAG: FAD-dependent oxidoreductase [Candidatus Adiutrix sp.]|jgi:nitrite reductase (NADH) large subunit|nr:FAD-dependent oxidoreductase [Candidatus Adiutrix sp.]